MAADSVAPPFLRRENPLHLRTVNESEISDYGSVRRGFRGFVEPAYFARFRDCFQSIHVLR